MKLVLLLVLAFYAVNAPCGAGRNVSIRPSVVKIGALLTFNSTIGRVAKVAINAAVDDVNADPSILPGTKLAIQMQDTMCSGFVGIVKALQFMERDIIAIAGPQCSFIAHLISHVSNMLQVPLLSFGATDPTLSPIENPFFLRTTQSDMFQMAAVAELVGYYQWKQVTAIYINDDFGVNGVSALGDSLQERRCKISYKAAFSPTATRSDIKDLLFKVAFMASRVIVLHANPTYGYMVFSVAREINMMQDGYVWIATDWLSSRLDSSPPLDSETMDNMQGVIVLRQHTVNSKKKSALVSRWSELTKKEKSGNFNLNSYGFYAYDTVWTIAHAIDAFFSDGGTVSFSNDPSLRDVGGGNLNLEAMNVFDDGKLLMSEIKKVDYVGVAGLVRFDSDGNLIRPAYDVINIIGTGYRIIGYWSNYSGLSIVDPEELYSKPPDHSSANQQLHDVIWPGETATKPRGWVFSNNGEELRIGIPYTVSFQDFVSTVPNSDTVKGLCIDVFTAAVSLLPYPVSYRFIPFGNGRENPSYSELVYKIASNDFDAAVGDIAIITNRTKIADFTQPFLESGLVILVAVKSHHPDAWAFLQSFTLKMWCVTGLFFLVLGAVLWILEHRINDDFRGPPKKQIFTTLWFSFSTLFGRQSENIVRNTGRAVLLIWFFVVLVIKSSYTASLTSILTVQRLSSPITGIQSLISSNETIGYQVGSYSENYLVEELGISPSRLKGLGSQIEYARALDLGPSNGGVAAVVDERPYVDLFLSDNCRYATVGSEFTRSGWGFAFERDSPLAADMSTAILSLSETGDLQRLRDKWLTRTGCSAQSSELKSDRLSLSGFWGLFLICGTVCFLALVLHFILMLRQFMKHTPPEEPGPSDQRRPKSSRSFHKFLSFVDDKEEVKVRFKRKQMEKSTMDDPAGIDN